MLWFQSYISFLWLVMVFKRLSNANISFLPHIFSNNGGEFSQYFSFQIYIFCSYELKKRMVSEPEPTLAALKWYIIEYKTSNSSARRVARPRQTQSSEKCFAKLQEMGRLTTSVSLLSSIQLYLLFCRGSEMVVATNDAECIRSIYLRLI